MLKYVWKNMKSNVRNRYFLLGILIVSGAFFCTSGIGSLAVQVQEKPLIIEEIFRYERWQYVNSIFEYSVGAMFKYGIGQYLYLVLPLTGIGYLLRFCDERYGGYDRLILTRTGKRNYFVGTLITSAVIAVMTVILSCILILTVLYIALPSGKGVEGVTQVADCIWNVVFICILAVIGNWLGLLIAVMTDSRFIALVLPVLVFEVWTEMCSSVRFDNPMVFLSMRHLVDPLFGLMQIWMYPVFVTGSMLLFGGGFYLLAEKKLEMGR